MGFPVCIEDPKYGRNALIFNAGVVLTPHSDEHASDPDDFGPVVIKLASILQTLEVSARTGRPGRSGSGGRRGTFAGPAAARACRSHACGIVLCPIGCAVRVRNAVGHWQKEPA